MPEKLFKIGEVMKYSKISRQTIHNYTMLGLIKPASRTDSGHRLYGAEVFDRLEKIDRYKRHHTLEEVKEMLDKMDAAVENQSNKIGEKTSELER
jgi:MerR family transcriptional regulator, copper efflux regulator